MRSELHGPRRATARAKYGKQHQKQLKQLKHMARVSVYFFGIFFGIFLFLFSRQSDWIDSSLLYLQFPLGKLQVDIY